MSRRILSISVAFSLIAAMCFVRVTPATAALVPGSASYQTIVTPHFRVHYAEGYEEPGQHAAETLEEMYVLIGREFDVYPKGRVEVLLTDQNDTANGFATVLPYNFMILRLVPPTAGHTLDHYNDWLRMLIAHEYTHILHLSDAGYPAKLLKFLLGKIVAPNALSPNWITEGVATYYESVITGKGRGHSTYTDMMLRTDILNDEFLSIDEAAGTMYDWPAWQAGYLYGVGFWNYLSKTYGRENVGKFSNKYGASLWFFSLNNKAKRVFGKSYYKLWKEWRAHLEERYRPLRDRLEAEGIKKGSPLLQDKEAFLTAPSYSPDGTKLAYVSSSVHRKAQVRLKSGDEDKLLFEGYTPSRLNWSPDGKQLIFSGPRVYKRYYAFQELYLYDLETERLAPLTSNKRIRNPTFSPDGNSVAVSIREKDRDRLGIYDLKKKELNKIGHSESGTRIDQLNWSPQRDLIVASVRQKGGNRNIVVYNGAGEIIRSVTKGEGTNLHPRWSPDGKSLYFSSDIDGIYNIYRHDWARGKTGKVSQVLSGAFAPTFSAASTTLVYQYYTGRVYELRESPAESFKQTLFVGRDAEEDDPGLSLDETEVSGTSEFKTRNYTLFSPALLPHYIQPNIAFIDNTIFANAILGSSDPLVRHRWSANINYRTDAKFVGYGAFYSYARYRPQFFTGYNDFVVNFGNIFGTGTDFFEERRRAFAGVSVGVGGGHNVSLQYFFEDRSAQSAIPAAAAFQPVLGNFAGVRFGYRWSRKTQYPAAISPEESYWLRTNVDFTNSILGASNTMERVILDGDVRQYVKLPWGKHHVLAFRQAGGIALGDTLTQGTFAVGGSLGESPIAAASTRLFTLRGLPLSTFLRDRALVFSMEYRMPLFSAQRGLGTTPLFMNQGSLVLFADYGNAWNKGQTPGGLDDFFDPFLLGLGAELRGHFVLAYHIPIMGRLGYGIIVNNRNRIAGLTDPLIGQDVKYGIMILEFGTSF